MDASDAARRALLAALSDLHTIAVWCCHDAGAVARSHRHFGRAVELATDAGDAYRAAYAMRHAGMMLIDRSEPNNALKLLQLGGQRLRAAPRDDPRVPALRSELAVVSGFALARLSPQAYQGQARSSLAEARDGWESPSAHARADMELITAVTLLGLGQLDAAETAVTTSVQTFQQGTDRREGVVADITLARLHVQAGEPDGLLLADTLDSRPGSDAQALAHRTREISATRA